MERENGLLLLSLIVFLDLFSVGLVIPLLPYYASSLGAGEHDHLKLKSRLVVNWTPWKSLWVISSIFWFRRQDSTIDWCSNDGKE